MTDPTVDRQKMALDPTRVETTYIHDASKFRPGFMKCMVNISDVALHHYRTLTHPGDLNKMREGIGVHLDSYLHQFAPDSDAPWISVAGLPVGGLRTGDKSDCDGAGSSDGDGDGAGSGDGGGVCEIASSFNSVSALTHLANMPRALATVLVGIPVGCNQSCDTNDLSILHQVMLAMST
ncbi:hypothetical protein C0Q70_02966 [Pomacea canaliculata]|uniref:Uncharacterized protein n=1 Tax=Pomacea canaliculata TaxID=400727 RepID=A0A2T7PRE1_POMCA|nr:hypothetical protein C0Q70_02966 [Pomacea canaliculata]